jgi:uncharacterized protein
MSASGRAAPGDGLEVRLLDSFWAPRQAQLRDHTLPVLLERLEEHGVVDNFRRLSGQSTAPRRGLWFTDSDLYKWMEAAAWAGRSDLLEPVIELVAAAARPDGYVSTFYDSGTGTPGRYQDLENSHEWYCGGHLIEAALAHSRVTASDVLLHTATRWADHLCATFGPRRDSRVDGHPEVELALVRLARSTGQERYLAQAEWIVEMQLANAGLSLGNVQLGGHAVKALYLASAIAELALAGAGEPYAETAHRLFTSMVDEHSYPTGAVGGRWLDESIGKRFELPDAMAYAESCAAVAATQFCQRIWELTGDPRSLEQAELLLFNAVPCGTGADGESWFYSQPHAVADASPETNPWARPYEYQQSMLLEWFPVRRHRWFDVTCCPTNLARMFSTVHRHVAALDAHGDVLVHLPVAARLTGEGWDVEVVSDYPEVGDVRLLIHSTPRGRQLLVRIPTWAGGGGHVPVGADGRVHIPIQAEWWETDPRVEGAGDTVFLRYGPVVRCVEQLDLPGVALDELRVDPTRPPETAFSVQPRGAPSGLHHPFDPGDGAPPVVSLPVTTIPYHQWANRGTTAMRMRFARRPTPRRPSGEPGATRDAQSL